jgi:hypothetical protein
MNTNIYTSSKELLGEVLEKKFSKSRKSKDDPAHKCKEWAKTKGYDSRPPKNISSM